MQSGRCDVAILPGIVIIAVAVLTGCGGGQTSTNNGPRAAMAQTFLELFWFLPRRLTSEMWLWAPVRLSSNAYRLHFRCDNLLRELEWGWIFVKWHYFPSHASGGAEYLFYCHLRPANVRFTLRRRVIHQQRCEFSDHRDICRQRDSAIDAQCIPVLELESFDGDRLQPLPRDHVWRTPILRS